MNSIADILDAAADEIEQNGHKKFDLGTPDGPKCATGAITHIVDGNPYGAALFDPHYDDVRRSASNLSFEACAAVADYLELPVFGGSLVSNIRRLAERWGTLVVWNNADEREPSDVVDAFRHTAKTLRGN